MSPDICGFGTLGGLGCESFAELFTNGRTQCAWSIVAALSLRKQGDVVVIVVVCLPTPNPTPPSCTLFSAPDSVLLAFKRVGFLTSLPVILVCKNILHG